MSTGCSFLQSKNKGQRRVWQSVATCPQHQTNVTFFCLFRNASKTLLANAVLAEREKKRKEKLALKVCGDLLFFFVDCRA